MEVKNGFCSRKENAGIKNISEERRLGSNATLNRCPHHILIPRRYVGSFQESAEPCGIELGEIDDAAYHDVEISIQRYISPGLREVLRSA